VLLLVEPETAGAGEEERVPGGGRERALRELVSGSVALHPRPPREHFRDRHTRRSCGESVRSREHPSGASRVASPLGTEIAVSDFLGLTYIYVEIAVSEFMGLTYIYVEIAVSEFLGLTYMSCRTSLCCMVSALGWSLCRAHTSKLTSC
jgi:hypothetical protein